MCFAAFLLFYPVTSNLNQQTLFELWRQLVHRTTLSMLIVPAIVNSLHASRSIAAENIRFTRIPNRKTVSRNPGSKGHVNGSAKYCQAPSNLLKLEGTRDAQKAVVDAVGKLSTIRPHRPCDLGEVAEWPNAPVLKTDVPQGTGGSNPPLSALRV